ncbi:hypothetical protein ACN95_08655 [Gordonia sihwensis]|uniref:wax ester/triacylglycerol synthase domain-containing protein n=1 Tax=Gordonia sihwensis TaxID=173559 RepID=UPI001C9301D3|nr:wax ester/triacylglycerol synthase domain-containing protein [Gordonia sihwensis]MBY4570086.1 hypothetical protein [Gordonia sihwensis]
MERLQPKDAMFVYTDGPRSRQITVCCGFFVSAADHDLPLESAVHEWFAARTRGPLFRRRLRRSMLDLEYPVWVHDDDFRLDRHLFIHDPMTSDGFLDFLGELAESAMDLSRPLWEIHVSRCPDGFGPIADQGFAVAVRIHHAAADGIAVQAILASLFGQESSAGNSERELLPGSDCHTAAGALTQVVRSITDFRRAVRDYRAALDERTTVRAAENYPVPPTDRTVTPIDGPVGPKRGVAVVYWPWTEVRQIRRSAGEATVNDLVLTVIGRAMHDYLCAVGSPPEGSLVASVPMTVRPREADGTVAEDNGRGNNRFVMMTVDLHSTEPDPITRLRAVHDAVLGERLRLSHSAEASADATVGYVPPGFLVRALRRRTEDSRGYPRRAEPDDRPFNTSVMTAYRLPFELRLLDCRQACGLGFGPINGTGISHAHVAGDDWCGVTALCDTDLVPDPSVYASALDAAYADLRNATLGTTAG